MNKESPSRNKRNALAAGGVMAADKEQWRAWENLSPAERLEAASRLWLQNRELSKHAKRNISLAVRARAARI